MIRSSFTQQWVPSIGKCFRSFYYPTTFLPPIDLEKNLLHQACPEDNTIQAAQKVVSLPGVQEILSHPLKSRVSEIMLRNKTLQDHGFRILSTKPLGSKEVPYYNVIEHDDLPGWIIKASGYRTSQSHITTGRSNEYNEISHFTIFDSLLRLRMNQRIRDVAKKIGIDVAVPDEYAVPYPKPEPGDVSRRYFIISQKLNVQTETETITKIIRMNKKEQTQLARKIALLIKNIGFADPGFNNIRLLSDGRIAIIDTEPAGLLVAKEDSSQIRGSSVEKCARIGLSFLNTITASADRLNPFFKEINKHYKKSLNEMSVKRIVLSIFCPLVPLVFLVIAVVDRIRIGRIVRQLLEEARKFNLIKNPPTDEVLKFQSQTKVILDSYYASIEGIPFPVEVIPLEFFFAIR